MKQCFLCDDVLLGADVQMDGLTLCVDCSRIFNKVKLRLMKAMIEADKQSSLQREPIHCAELFF